MSLVGNLEDLGLGEILQIVSLSRKTGTLVLHSRGRDAAIVFRQGQVVKASCSTYDQTLGALLIQRGVITPDTLRKALTVQQTEGFRERLGSILITVYGVAQDVVEEVVREQIECIIFSLFEWAKGTFDFILQDMTETADTIRMDPLQFMLEQGLNPQFLAMEGSRILDEKRDSGLLESDDDSDSAAETAPVASPDVPAPKPQMVIVDDDGPTLRAISEGLQEKGYVVHAMTRSEDTLIKVDSLVRAGTPPTVLIDLIMPKMDGSGVLGGVELLELLSGNFKDLPVMVMTDYHFADAEKRVCELGCRFIMKPRRAEIADKEKLASFLELLHANIVSVEAGEGGSEWQGRYNLGDELRMEMDDDDDIPVPTENVDTSELSLLRGMLEELNHPDLQAGVLLLVLRFASEFLNRAIVFMINGDDICGVGQFGISDGAVSGDERVRAIHFPLESGSMFREPCRSGHAVTFIPDPTSVDNYIFEQLGGEIPEQVFVGPIVSKSRVIGFLYGDNLPDHRPVNGTELLEIFLSQAGLSMEKNMLEQQLHERARP